MEHPAFDMLRRFRRFTIVGMSASPGKDAHDIPAFMAAQGYRVDPVNPSRARILGAPAYGSLREVPLPLEIVGVYRPGPETPDHVRLALELGANAIWLPAEVESEESRRLAAEAGVPYVEQTCMRTAYRLAFGRAGRPAHG